MTDLFSYQADRNSVSAQTRREAHRALSEGDVIRGKVLQIINERGPSIVDEVKVILEESEDRKFDRSTVAARFTELKQAGKIEETGDKRQTPMGRNAAVFRISA